MFSSRMVILGYLKEINKQGTTIILYFTLYGEAENLCSRVAIVDRGQIISIGNPRELLNEHPEFQEPGKYIFISHREGDARLIWLYVQIHLYR